MCTPYFVNLNNTFQLKTLLFFVHLRSQQQRTEKVISNYLFEVFQAVVGSVEWSGVSGVDSPGSVPDPPQRQRSQQCASCADVHYRVLVQWTPLFAIVFESAQHQRYWRKEDRSLPPLFACSRETRSLAQKQQRDWLQSATPVLVGFRWLC